MHENCLTASRVNSKWAAVDGLFGVVMRGHRQRIYNANHFLSHIMVSSVRNLLALVGLTILVLYFAQHFPQMQKGMDFADFYAAARMVRDGHGHDLYLLTAQDQYLARYSGRVGTYFIHPPFEALIYLPFSYFTVPFGYGLWCAFNAVLLLLAARLLANGLFPGRWPLLVLISLVFVPLLLDFMQGQDSILLLYLLCAAFVEWQQKHDFSAGCLLAGGLIKFHLAIPIAIMMAFNASRRFLSGFSVVALGLLAVSAGIVGGQGLLSYPGFLVQLRDSPSAGLHSHAMANFRGLFATVMPQDQRLALGLTIGSSILTLAFAVHAARRSGNIKRQELVWAGAVLLATLVSYHLSPHDLTILLLVIAVILHHLLTADTVPKSRRIWFLLGAGVLLLPPLHVILLARHAYAQVSLVAMFLFCLTCLEISRVSALRP